MPPTEVTSSLPSDNMVRVAPSIPSHIEIIVLFERLGAALSVVGVLSIFIAFAAFKRLRTVPNTFIIFASVANLGASIACLIGYSGVLAGSDSHLCQAQAFMFELFMQSDPWWSFAMAVNVYMVFFFSANPNSFLRYWYAYFLVCYGIPFIPALWLLLAHDKTGAPVYGDATIWCWIGKSSSDLRIYTYYLPIWVCIVLSSLIYVAVGYYVFKQRNQLRNLSLSNPHRDITEARDSGEKDLFANAAHMGSANRKVLQVTTINTESERITRPLPGATPLNWFKGPVEDQSNFDQQVGASTTAPIATTITSITAEPRHDTKESFLQRIQDAFNGWCNKFSHMDPVKLAYLRTSFVFAVSVLITWTPSSINRVHDIVRPNEFSYPLNLASAIVLPLQGLWNAVIFFSTSWLALRQEVRAKVDQLKGVPKGRNVAEAVRYERDRFFELERRATRQNDDTNSEISIITTASLSGSRDNSIKALRETPSKGL
ncbi:putative G-protein coupled receptor [Rosellinia necatrix]|uniref:Putative G-protein coupled receptor n=1 Tax=Rosellinia necatrix TaxID=77044 RepID=A0A1S7UJM5_ROSNE|nr:putative G-protein coupled receptor [Rosellinia necatrix]